MSIAPTLIDALKHPFRSAWQLMIGLKPAWFFALVILAYLAIALPILVLYLPPQADEDLFSEPAFNLLTEGRLVSHIVVGMEEGVLWQPPLYFFALVPVIKAFGYSITVFRSFSVTVACFGLLLMYILGRTVIGEAQARAATLLLAVNPLFVLYSKMGRMDSLCLLFMLLALFLALRAVTRGSTANWIWAGFASGAAALTHPFGVLVVLSIIVWLLLWGRRMGIRRSSALIPFLVPTVGMIVLWCAWGVMHIDALTDQWAYQFARKEFNLLRAPAAFFARFKYVPTVAVVYGLAFAGSIAFILRPWRIASNIGLLATFCVIVGGAILFVYEPWYHIHVYPVAYLIGAWMLAGSPSVFPKAYLVLRRALPPLLVLNAVAYFGYLNYRVRLEESSSADYRNFILRISAHIKPHATILALGSPSVFWGFREIRPDVAYLSDVFLTPEYGRREASRIDYVVMSRSFDPPGDESWHRDAYRRISSALESAGKILVKTDEVGTKRRYAFSAQIFDVVEQY
jgi:4-amino-4-deoxy-L-arabinose transferase-like glycosyltransferase